MFRFSFSPKLFSAAAAAWSLVLAPSSSRSGGLGLAEAAKVRGYLIDKQCLELCLTSEPDEKCAPDDLNVFYKPQGHTGWCLELPPCVASGYVLMSEFKGDDGRHTQVLDLANDASQSTVVSFINAGTSGPFPLVVAEYDDAQALQVEGVPSSAGGVTISDTWATDDAVYSGAATHQVLCQNSASPDLSINNMCFRSDVAVSETSSMFVIQSNGCPDHASMQGSSGSVSNPQDQDAGKTCDSCSTGKCCGSDKCCSSGKCDGGDCCSAKCDGGDCCSAKCDGGNCCSGMCYGGDCCSGKCDGGNCCSGKCDGGACCSGKCDGGACCSGKCDGGACCSGKCDGGACCSAKCDGGDCCSGKCDGGCKGCCAGCCGGCCGSVTATNGHGHSAATGKYDPTYQHYTAMIPKTPGDPGAATYFTKEDEVVGIMANGILLDNHKPTWSYDNCNGHSDTKHQYHYHIPPKCLLEGMGVDYPQDTFWWKNGDAVRDYADMAAQWPASGKPSPVLGFALDGYPIFGPHDDAGNVQRGKDFGGDVDECNGKVDAQGNYGYYLTVDPPFAPPCLRGEKGTFSYHTTSMSCPKDGIQNSIFNTTSGSCASTAFSEVASCMESMSVAGDSGAKTHTSTAAALGTTGAAAAAFLMF